MPTPTYTSHAAMHSNHALSRAELSIDAGLETEAKRLHEEMCDILRDVKKSSGVSRETLAGQSGSDRRTAPTLPPPSGESAQAEHDRLVKLADQYEQRAEELRATGRAFRLAAFRALHPRCGIVVDSEGDVCMVARGVKVG